MRRQQSAQTESVAFRLGERGAFVENGIMQPVNALDGQRAVGLWISFCVVIFS